MLPRSKYKSNSGAGLLNTVINSLPFELHLPGYQYCGPGTDLKKRLALSQPGINGLDSACREHDIAYEKSNSLSDRGAADSVLEERAWSRVGAKDADFKEKAAAWFVTTGMKAKRKIGAGCGFSSIVGVCKKALKKSLKSCSGTPNMNSLIKSTVLVARKHVKSVGTRSKNKNKPPRVIRVPKTGGSLTLIPVLAGLSALGILAGGVANIVRTIRGIRSDVGTSVHLGKGVYLRPYKSAGSYTIARKSSAITSRINKRKKSVTRKKQNNKSRKIKSNKQNNKSRKIKSNKKSLKSKN
ncbi:uncharacterized protein LOC132926627 [Rhopalosiphum padi]|uniref:uncharacterized protein LOC132926627 n=1 Tax=Rhopalosiphum padi TaxID=40932 RepID=UPI00298E0AD6|nr:uncharacterized protein LOC132926627 [Rhopalosiphum padi]